MAAQDRLIPAPAKHLEGVGEHLREDRVRRVIEPTLTGAEVADRSNSDYDPDRCMELAALDPAPRIANAIYNEFVEHQLTNAPDQEVMRQAV